MDQEATRWDEAKDQRKLASDPLVARKVMEIVAAANKNGLFPTTREIANVYNGRAADDAALPTSFQDALLQGVLNPMRKAGKLQAKYWERNQLIWKVPEAPKRGEK
jgi:hypothetical protein